MKTGKLSLDRVTRWLWALTVLFLPVTSFRYFPFLGASTQVRPLSAFPLVLLLLLLAYRQWRRRKWGLPGAMSVLVAFLLVALVATAIGNLFAPLDLFNQGYLVRALRAWVTIGIGLAFLVAAIWMNEDEDGLRFTLIWLYVGLAANILWSGVQVLGIFTDILPRSLVNTWQEMFSIHGLVVPKRVLGFAFEPSWLAGQLATLYMPWLFVSLIRGYRVFRWRWVEPVLMLGLLGVMVLTYSRSGILLAIGVAALTFVLADWQRVRQVWKWIFSPFRGGRSQARATNDWLNLAVRIGIIVAVLAGALGTFSVLSSNDYFAQLWRADASNLVEYMVNIYAGPRLAYMISGWYVFDAHPLTGVGIGASGFYMYDTFPDWAQTTIPEIARMFSPHSYAIPNPKNLFVRLLAETGILGFWLFFLFNLAVLGQVIKLMKSPKKLASFVGVAGLFTWLAVLTYNFTQDSFAMPNIWIGLGMVLGFSLSGRE